MAVFWIKLLAVVSMLADHTACVLDSAGILESGVSELLHAFGRMAFPLYAFLAANGWRHTRSRPRYLRRLLVFAGISQLPFTFALQRLPTGGYRFLQLNVFFTLAAGLLLTNWLQALPEADGALQVLHGKRLLPVLVLLPLVPWMDYSIWGVLLIAVLCLAGQRRTQGLVLAVWALLEYTPDAANLAANPLHTLLPLLFALCAVGAAFLYNGKKGPSLQYAFYAVYPVHLILLALLAQFVPR